MKLREIKEGRGNINCACSLLKLIERDMGLQRYKLLRARQENFAD